MTFSKWLEQHSCHKVSRFNKYVTDCVLLADKLRVEKRQWMRRILVMMLSVAISRRDTLYWEFMSQYDSEGVA